MTRTRRLAPAPVLLLAGALLLAGCSSFRSYAAEVNGERISLGELNRELDAILDNKEYLEQVDQQFAGEGQGERAVGEGRGTLNSVFVAAVLNRRIGFELIHQEVVRRKLTVSAEQRRQTLGTLEQRIGEPVFNAFPKTYRDDLVRVFSEQMALEEALGESAVDDATIKEFYDANREAFDQTCVRHILVGTEAAAAGIKGRLDAGEDFATIARAESTDNQVGGGSAQNGGDLGCLPKGSLVPEFEAAMDALQPGQVSGPVQTTFGFHVIQVIERRAVSLEEATPQIRETLQSQSPNPVGLFVNEAMTKGDIKVNPRYGEFVTEPSPGVRAPKLLDAAGTSVPAQRGPEPQAPEER
ncbi:MAG: peptidylprolyl isomerase [Acidimicrobiales bacterium]